MQYWLVKTEPDTFSWQDLVQKGGTMWDGVRNYTARNNLRAMAVGDEVLVYHSVTGKEIMGVARVVQTAYQDPTTPDMRWVAVDVEPLRALPKAVSLAQIKADALLADLPLVRQSRLSVMPIPAESFARILLLAGDTEAL